MPLDAGGPRARSDGLDPSAPRPRSVSIELGGAAAPRARPVVDTAGAAAPRPRASSAPVIAAAAIALVLGGVGGALLTRAAQRSRPLTLVPVVISSDRPAEVLYEQRPIGHTPVTAVFPVGHHQVSLREDGGAPRQLEFDAVAEGENRVEAALDSLTRSP
jgi:hypothetical protein